MAAHPIPEEMTAVVLQEYAGAQALQVVRRPVPTPGPQEVLIRVAASPVNPSDLAFLAGRYGLDKPAPVVPGIEGSGTVVASGGGVMGRYLLGKRVACVAPARGDGLWAEYMVAPAGNALPLHRSVELEQGAMSLANPLTALAFMEIARAGGHTAIVNTAAASALGQMVLRLAARAGIVVINVVRRQEQVELLTRQGAAVVLNSADEGFPGRLRDACQQHRARLAFDAVAGTMTAQLLEALPNNGRVTVYGGLSMEATEILATHFIFQGKSVDGFWLTPWMERKNLLQSMLFWRRAQRLMTSALQTHVRVRYPLAEARNAVLDYQRQMTGGKVLIIP